jgi:plastocyanin
MRMLAALGLAALSLASVAPPAKAGDLTVTVTSAGRPVADAVVMAYPASGARPARPTGAYRMAQQGMQFEPFVLIAPLGAEVSFPNFDKVRHHVYSFSPVKPFELKLYGRGEAPKVRFDKPGVVAIGCNIHDDMAAFIRVVDTAFAVKTSTTGSATLGDLPPGPVRVVVWHPYMRTAGGEMRASATAPAHGTARLPVNVALRSPRLRHGAY